MKILNLDNLGDTIVEVLIAMAVVSTVLAGAYTSTRNSANTTRAAQEQGEALKLAESQLEQIKIEVDAGRQNIKGEGDFCLVSGTITAGCNDTGSGGLYDVIVNHTAGSSEFLVNVSWDSLQGGRNVLSLGYKTQ